MTVTIGRRELLAALGGMVAAFPLAARAQQPGVALISLLSGAQLDDRMLSAIRQGLKEAGYVEGRNVAIKYARPMVASTGCRDWPLSWWPTRWP